MTNIALDGDRPSIHGQMLGKALALIADMGRRDAPVPIPDPCLTCAFREGSMPNMTAGTGMIALNIVLGVDRDRFACHHGMTEGQPKKLCAGYVAAMLAPFSQVKEIILAFHAELAEIEEAPDTVRAEFDAWLHKVDPNRKLDVYQAAREYAKSQIAAILTADCKKMGGTCPFDPDDEVVRRRWLRAETMVAIGWKREPVQITPHNRDHGT